MGRKSNKTFKEEEEIVETKTNKYTITTKKGQRRMDKKYVLILNLIQENKRINIANLNTKLSEKGYNLNYKNLFERIKKLGEGGYLNKHFRELKQPLLILSEKGKGGLEYYKDKIPQLTEMPVGKDTKTFKVKIKCDNCGFEGNVGFPVKTILKNAECPKCEVKGYLHHTEKT